ncbi:Arc family DNA-binding protein [Acetobacter sp. P1H12_c]|uniref:Arc family DNA-binding protein n=1 Tax=Acetobacter sp. P1H12_c TaxID=2762621 RepID=UPI001C03F6BE|nr:Arc family DNA-binding protein [Acetobacter sp. P1H12_c]
MSEEGTVRVTLRLPKDVHSQVFELAHDHRQSLNAEIVSILSGHILRIGEQRSASSDMRQVSDLMASDPISESIHMAVSALRSLSALEQQISEAKQELEDRLYKATNEGKQ